MQYSGFYELFEHSEPLYLEIEDRLIILNIPFCSSHVHAA